jgi:hypothetical protein
VNIHRCYSAAIIQAALLTIASPMTRAQDTTTDQRKTPQLSPATTMNARCLAAKSNNGVTIPIRRPVSIAAILPTSKPSSNL